MNTAGLLYPAILGAIVATLCDANHVLTRTLSYPTPLFAGQAFWVFPGFFVAFAFMGVTYFQLSHWLGSRLTLSGSRSAGTLQAMTEALSRLRHGVSGKRLW